MFEATSVVIMKETEDKFRVVSPVDGEEATTVLWLDKTCTSVIVVPSDQLELTEENFLDGQHSRLEFNVYADKNNKDGFVVSRRIVGVGLDPIVSAYADFRGYLGELTDLTIEEIDKLIADVPKV